MRKTISKSRSSLKSKIKAQTKKLRIDFSKSSLSNLQSLNQNLLSGNGYKNHEEPSITF